MSIEIGDEQVKEVAGADGKVTGYLIKSEICNTGSTNKTVYVTQHPYSRFDGEKIEKIGASPKETQLTIPANQCITVAFEFPGDIKPVKTYTDVYEPKPHNPGEKGRGSCWTESRMRSRR